MKACQKLLQEEVASTDPDGTKTESSAIPFRRLWVQNCLLNLFHVPIFILDMSYISIPWCQQSLPLRKQNFPHHWRLAATLMCRHAASTMVKMWLPVWLGTHGRVGSAVAAMLLMYVLEEPRLG